MSDYASEINATRSSVSKGRGLAWSLEEDLALVRVASSLPDASVKGAYQTAAEWELSIKRAFIAQGGLPAGDPASERRWAGRPARAIKDRWKKIVKDCKTYQSGVLRVNMLQLTGNPTAHDLSRCYAAVYNDERRITSCYEIIRDPRSPVGPPFPISECYDFLIKNTGILVHDSENASHPASRAAVEEEEKEVSSLTPGQNIDENEGKSQKLKNRQRPEGCMSAKRRKRADESSSERNSEISSALGGISAAFVEQSKANRLQDISMRQSEYDIEAFKILCGPGSGASESEKLKIGGILRQKWLKKLGEKETGSASSPINVPLDGNELVDDAVLQ
jgi:archaellum component FlaG (FlaF/FlaG flagellin family)